MAHHRRLSTGSGGTLLVFSRDEVQSEARPVESSAAANLVLPSQNNYWDLSALAGYRLDANTDLQLQYNYYRADDYQNNAAFSVPYGAGAEENGLVVTLLRQLSRSLRWTLKYGFFSNHDQLYGGHLDYRAQLVYSSLQYRF